MNSIYKLLRKKRRNKYFSESQVSPEEGFPGIAVIELKDAQTGEFTLVEQEDH